MTRIFENVEGDVILTSVLFNPGQCELAWNKRINGAIQNQDMLAIDLPKALISSPIHFRDAFGPFCRVSAIFAVYYMAKPFGKQIRQIGRAHDDNGGFDGLHLSEYIPCSVTAK